MGTMIKKLAQIATDINSVATPQNAKTYSETTDKYVFCLDLLGLSLTHDGATICDSAVEVLEERFRHGFTQ